MIPSVQGPTRVPPSVAIRSLSIRPMRAVHGPGMSTYNVELECPDNRLALCILRRRTRSADVCPWPHESATICLRWSSVPVPLAHESLSTGRACRHVIGSWITPSYGGMMLVYRIAGPGLMKSVHGPTRAPSSVSVHCLSIWPMRAVHGPGM